MTHYLIVYFYHKGTDTGFGTVEGHFRHNPPTMEDVQEVQSRIQDKFAVDNVMVLNWLPLSEEEG